MGMRKYLLAGAVVLATAGVAFAAQHGQGQMMGQGMKGMGMMGMGMGMMGSGCPMRGDKGMGGMGGGGMGMMGHNMMADPEKMTALLDERLADIKKELGIADAQEKAWEVYAKAARDRVTTMQGMHQAKMASMRDGKAVDRLETHISVMETMLDSMKALLPATKALYEALPEDKRAKADTLLGGCGMM